MQRDSRSSRPLSAGSTSRAEVAGGLKTGNGSFNSEDNFLRGWVNCQMPSPYFLPENIVLDIGTQVIVENDLGSNPVTISLGQRHILYGITYMRNLKKKKKK